MKLKWVNIRAEGDSGGGAKVSMSLAHAHGVTWLLCGKIDGQTKIFKYNVPT